MKKVLTIAYLAGLVVFVSATHAAANPCPPGNPPTNCAPPPGAILDLDGTAIPTIYTLYTVGFTATQATTNVSFAFREDPAFLFLDDVSLVNTTTASGNLILNGGFEDGPVGASAPANWTYLNAFGAAAAGEVAAISPRSGSNVYYDGAVQAYDGITQAIATNIGDLYTLSFWLFDNSNLPTFSRLSTNGDVSSTGGNGIDLLVYAGGIPTLTPVPEPATVTLVGLGLGAIYWRRRRAQAPH